MTSEVILKDILALITLAAMYFFKKLKKVSKIFKKKVKEKTFHYNY